MNFLQKKSTWTNQELWLFKLTVFCCGLLGGSYFADFFDSFSGILLILAFAGSAYTLAIWFKKQRWG